MVGERTDTRLEKVLETIEKSQGFMNIENIFKEIQTSKDGGDTILKLRETTLAIESLINDFLMRVLTSLNNVKPIKQKYLRNGKQNRKLLPGDRLWQTCKGLMDPKYSYVTMREAVLLLDVAYERAVKHFDNSGRYLDEYLGIDRQITRLPVKYVQFKRKIEPPRRRRNLSKKQSERLNVFLNYLRGADLEFNINELKPIYLKFEEAMFFCAQVPEQYQDIPVVKRNKFKGSWNSYKRSEADKKSQYSYWIKQFQKCEKQHPNIESTMLVFVQNKKAISKTSPLEFKEGNI